MINKRIVITILKLDIARFIVCWLIIDGEYCKWIYALKNNESFTQYHCFLIVLSWNTSFFAIWVPRWRYFQVQHMIYLRGAKSQQWSQCIFLTDCVYKPGELFKYRLKQVKQNGDLKNAVILSWKFSWETFTNILKR